MGIARTTFETQTLAHSEIFVCETRHPNMWCEEVDWENVDQRTDGVKKNVFERNICDLN